MQSDKELIGVFASPVDLTAPRLDPRRLFVVEQDGIIRVVKDGAEEVDSQLTASVEPPRDVTPTPSQTQTDRDRT